MLNHPIVEESFKIIDREVANHNFTREEYAIARRVIHATADFDYLELLQFRHNAIASGIAGIQNQVPIVTDVTMVKQGIRSMVSKTFGNEIISAVELAKVAESGKTRTETGLLKCWDKYPEAIYVIGNAPTALLALCDRITNTEFIFPNIKMSMTWKDRLLFGIPAIGAGISLIVKILPQLLLILGVIIYVTLGHQPIEELQVREEEVRNITPLLVTILSLVVTLGGFAFKQYTSYKSKQIKFQKNVTETLFFRNMASNVGVFQYLIDAAEEEECKEIILVYYHLLTTNSPLTASQLDAQIEAWMEERLGKKVDFDIENTLRSLESIKVRDHQEKKNISLLIRNEKNHCYTLPLDQAKQVIDRVWDNVFQYS